MTIGRAREHHVAEEFALGMRPFDHDEFAVKHLAAAVPAAPKYTILAGITGPDIELENRDGSVRDDVEVALSVGGIVVKCSHESLLCALDR